MTSPSVDRAARADQHPDDERAARATTSRSAAARRSATTRSRTWSTRRATRREDLDLYIAGEQKDPMPEPVPPADEQDNQDELYVVYFFHKWSGAVGVAVPVQPRDQQRVGDGDPGGSGRPQQVRLRLYGHRRRLEVRAQLGLPPVGRDQAGYVRRDGQRRDRRLAAQAVSAQALLRHLQGRRGPAYCQDGQSYTKNGTQVDLFDTQQIIWPNAIENPWNASNPGSLWMRRRSTSSSQDQLARCSTPPCTRSALQRTRYRELSPVRRVRQFLVRRSPRARSHRGRALGAPVHQHDRARSVFSPTYCTHNEYDAGRRAAVGLQPVHDAGLQDESRCCGRGRGDRAGPSPASRKADTRLPGRRGVHWPAGKVWPRMLPNADQSIYPTYLLGPTGAPCCAPTASADRASSATISGLGLRSGVAGRVGRAFASTAAARRTAAGTLLGEVRADQALATPLAREVSAACDGPGRTYARHGFSFTLPANQAGNVFVYAIDESTANGPAAPPTLIRNGVVHGPALRAQRARHGRRAVRELQHLRGQHLRRRHARRPAAATAWTDECAAAADACAPADSSAPVNSRSFAAVTTGWIEAPVTRHLHVRGVAAAEPAVHQRHQGARLVRDLAGDDQRHRSALAAGQQLPPALGSLPGRAAVGRRDQGLTWQPPGTIGQTAIPLGQPVRDRARQRAPADRRPTSRAPSRPAAPVGSRASTRTSTSTRTSRRPGPPPLDLPAALRAVLLGDLGRRDRPVVHGGPHLLRRRQRQARRSTIDGAAVSFPGPAARADRRRAAARTTCAQVGDKLDASCNSCVARHLRRRIRTAATAATSRTTRSSPSGTRAASPRSRRIAPGRAAVPPLTRQPPRSPQKKSAAVPLQAGVHYRDPLELRQPDRRQDDSPAVVQPAAGEAGGPAVRAPARGACRDQRRRRA